MMHRYTVQLNSERKICVVHQTIGILIFGDAAQYEEAQLDVVQYRFSSDYLHNYGTAMTLFDGSKIIFIIIIK